MINKLYKIIIAITLLFIFLLYGCGAGHVSVGVGVYVPGAWVGPYGGAGYYPPVGIGYPIY